MRLVLHSFAVATAAAVAALALLPVTLHAQARGCRPIDPDAQDMRAFAIKHDTANTDYSRKLRERLHLAVLPADSVTFVTDEATCRRAAAAYATIYGPDARQAGVHVVRLGPLLVIGRPDGHAGGLLFVADAATYARRELWSM